MERGRGTSWWFKEEAASYFPSLQYMKFVSLIRNKQYLFPPTYKSLLFLFEFQFLFKIAFSMYDKN